MATLTWRCEAKPRFLQTHLGDSSYSLYKLNGNMTYALAGSRRGGRAHRHARAARLESHQKRLMTAGPDDGDDAGGSSLSCSTTTSQTCDIMPSCGR